MSGVILFRGLLLKSCGFRLNLDPYANSTPKLFLLGAKVFLGFIAVSGVTEFLGDLTSGAKEWRGLRWYDSNAASGARLARGLLVGCGGGSISSSVSVVASEALLEG